MRTLSLKVYKKNGLHVRLAAAFITVLQSLLENKDKLKRIYVIYNGKKVQVNNLLSLVSLKIGQGEEFILSFEEHVSSHVIAEIINFFKQTEQEDSRQAEADRLMMENSITLQEAIAGLPNGIVVVDRENVITYVNEAAARLLEKAPQDLVNHRADLVIPHSRLHTVMATGKTEVAKKQKIKNHTLLTNRSPLIFNGQTIGAVAVFQDISILEKVREELKVVQELQQRLNLVLESVSDLIGLTDQYGEIIYSNEEMQSMLDRMNKKGNIQSVIGEKVWKSLVKSPNPFMQAILINDECTYITKIKPLIIDEEFRGTVVTLSPLDELKILWDKLDIMEQRTKYLEIELSKHQGLHAAFNKIIGNSEVLIDSLSMANKVSKTDSTVIVTGESGTGKELVARAIHETSERKEKPFIRVNCAAIPPNLMESELFGHEKGAFTGAYKTHRGKFELAHKGTIFLDEIGDLNIELQAKILRVLQEKEVDRVGGVTPISIDVRVIAATNQDLAKRVAEGKFREDLFYRLHVIPIHLPPLRSRKDDLPLLVDYFREHFNQQLGKNINDYEQGFIEALTNYHWPGNIRELQNVIERMFNLTDSTQLTCKELPSYILHTGHKANSNPPARQPGLFLNDEDKILTLEEYEKQIFTCACQYYPSFNQLAQALGITHKTAAKKIRKYGLEQLLGKKYQEI